MSLDVAFKNFCFTTEWVSASSMVSQTEPIQTPCACPCSTIHVMLLAVGRDKTSIHVCSLIAKKIKTLPKHLAVSLTWDRGKEMAEHVQFSVVYVVEVFRTEGAFC